MRAVRRDLTKQNMPPAGEMQTDGSRSPVAFWKRLALILLILFVSTGLSLLIYLSAFYLPAVYREQAERMIAPNIRAAQIGDIVNLGVYEQDNDTSNGPEPIQWVLLDKLDKRCLLMSVYGLDSLRFNTVEAYVTWDRSSILTWLNSTFYYDAFEGAERAMLVKTDQQTDTNPYFDTYPGSVTHERIFLANIAQIAKYLDTEEKRFCQATPYAIARGAATDEKTGNCSWWLRSPGFDSTAATRVLMDGRVNYCGYRVQSDHQVIRPWLWVTIDPNNLISED